MRREHDLAVLLREMDPRLMPAHYVFCSFPSHRLPDGIDPVCTFREAEGLSAIMEKNTAEALHLPYTCESRMITLAVHSDLSAVGFLSSVCTALAESGIPCNAISAYHHDHLFIPSERAAKAMDVLHALAVDAR